MAVSKEILDKINESIDIVEVIGDFVTLKKKGHYYSACCPFHNEKTPSFAVTPAKGIYKCFGCGKAGDAIRFVMDIEGLSYIEAMRYLAKKYGIDIPEGSTKDVDFHKQNERESLLIVLQYAKNYFQKILQEHDKGQSIGYSYFKERGFSDSTIKKFDLGYSLEEWEGLFKQAVKEGFSIEMLEKAGLVVRKENANDKNSVRHYDRFRARVIFPIHNVTGKVIAFGARILKTDKNQPKYLNSPETEVYHKSKILYGIYQAKQSIRQEDNCFLVEGYTDVISLHQAGIENVVASSGTSLTEDQVRLISRYTINITILYDGDIAGIKASMRGIDMILEQGMNVNVVTFPDSEDPDSFVRKLGGEEFKKYIKASKKDFISFKTALFLKETEGDPVKKAGVIREIVESISKIPDAIKRAVFFKQCSALMEIEEQTLISEYNKIVLKKNQEKKHEEIPPPDLPPDFFNPDYEPIREEKKPEMSAIEAHEREILRLIVNYAPVKLEESKRLYEYVLEQVEDIDFHTDIYRRMLEMIKSEHDMGNLPDKGFFIQHNDEKIRNEAVDMLVTKYDYSPNWEQKFKIYITKEEDNLAEIIYSCVLKLKKLNVMFLLEQNKEQLKNNPSEEEQIRLMMIYTNLKKVDMELAKMLGNVISK
ncbi:DNA primase [Sporocytophaga myxococcoides]|uniref:DNA primase n=1 Tax=Sporocytophaga myxococcoides TaxID=153721 RepID=A0A098LDV0_9BACT|nr:DNA primase [Sporocytophaga myxococcoides]GAL85135.1 DNA primase [Sporocytophaga myxococcoides]